MSRIEQLAVIAHKSKKPLPWYGLAMEYRSVGDLAAAVTTFEKVHALDPTYVPAYFMRAQVHEERGERARAQDALEKGITAARAVGDAHAVSEMQSMLESLL